MPTNFVTENRIGRFDIDYDVMEDTPDSVVAVLRDMIIIEATHNFRSRRIEYIAYCPRFDVVASSGLTPWYNVVVIHNFTTNVNMERSGKVDTNHEKTHRRQIRSL